MRGSKSVWMWERLSSFRASRMMIAYQERQNMITPPPGGVVFLHSGMVSKITVMATAKQVIWW